MAEGWGRAVCAQRAVVVGRAGRGAGAALHFKNKWPAGLDATDRSAGSTAAEAQRHRRAGAGRGSAALMASRACNGGTGHPLARGWRRYSVVCLL